MLKIYVFIFNSFYYKKIDSSDLRISCHETSRAVINTAAVCIDTSFPRRFIMNPPVEFELPNNLAYIRIVRYS
jgi:hypothetical protein